MRRLTIAALAVAALVLTIGGVQVLDRPGGAVSVASSSWAIGAHVGACNSAGHSGYSAFADIYDPAEPNEVRLEIYENSGTSWWCAISSATSLNDGDQRWTFIDACGSQNGAACDLDGGDYQHYAGPIYIKHVDSNCLNVVAERNEDSAATADSSTHDIWRGMGHTGSCVVW